MELLTYPFFTRALAAALLASVCCGVIGTYIVSRRMVFISGGITHASFGGIGMAYYFGFDPVIGAALFAVLSSFGIDALSRRARMRMDTLIGVLWSFGMAVGIIFIFISPGYAPDLMGYLFGSIITVSWSDLLLLAAVTAATVFAFSVFYRTILSISFDEEFAQSRGLPVRALSLLLLGLTAVTVVACIKVAGIILVLSLLTLPQAAASVLTGSFRRMMVLSIALGALSSLTGLVISYHLDIPSGATIIFVSAVVFALVKAGMSVYIRIKIRENLEG